MRPRLAVGTMTGTSLDALDASLVRLEGSGMEIRASLERHVTADLGGLRPRLRAACDGTAMAARDFASLAMEFGRLHADVVAGLVRESTVDLVALHGQTVFHGPPVSWQLVNPWPVAHRLRCPVVSDLRGSDLACGGQGAPITPLADWILFRDARPTAVVNLGGFCNITWLPAASEGPAGIRGADICPCNHLLDAAARRALGRPFDANGAAASSGTVREDRSVDLKRALEAAAGARRSLGNGDEAVAVLEAMADLPAADLLATVCRLVGQRIGTAAVSAGPRPRVVLAGGGSRNAALRGAIAGSAEGGEVLNSAALGVPAEARESMEMAILGALAWDGIAVTLPAVTSRGASTARDGLWCLPPA